MCALAVWCTCVHWQSGTLAVWCMCMHVYTDSLMYMQAGFHTGVGAPQDFPPPARVSLPHYYYDCDAM